MHGRTHLWAETWLHTSTHNRWLCDQHQGSAQKVALEERFYFMLPLHPAAPIAASASLFPLLRFVSHLYFFSSSFSFSSGCSPFPPPPSSNSVTRLRFLRKAGSQRRSGVHVNVRYPKKIAEYHTDKKASVAATAVVASTASRQHPVSLGGKRASRRTDGRTVRQRNGLRGAAGACGLAEDLSVMGALGVRGEHVMV